MTGGANASQKENYSFFCFPFASVRTPFRRAGMHLDGHLSARCLLVTNTSKYLYSFSLNFKVLMRNAAGNFDKWPDKRNDIKSRGNALSNRWKREMIHRGKRIWHVTHRIWLEMIQLILANSSVIARVCRGKYLRQQSRGQVKSAPKRSKCV